MDTDTFIINIKAKDVDKDIANDVKKRFDTSNYEMERPLMIVELGGKIMTKFVGLRTKMYSYWIYDGSEDKKAKGTKECITNSWFRLYKMFTKK